MSQVDLEELGPPHGSARISSAAELAEFLESNWKEALRQKGPSGTLIVGFTQQELRLVIDHLRQPNGAR